jgi:Na+/serine symporter
MFQSALVLLFLNFFFGSSIFSQLLGKSKSPTLSKLLESFVSQPILMLGPTLYLGLFVSSILYTVALDLQSRSNFKDYTEALHSVKVGRNFAFGVTSIM